MAFPNDLSDVVVFKIHPAIGIARLSNNEDFYVFGQEPGSLKSNGLIKRQAVQFRVFAYGENHEGLGELTAKVMKNLNMTAVWSAKVGNRKIAKWERKPLSSNESVITAEASSDDANAGHLIGSLPGFAEGAAIPLGQITSTGLFIPPKGGVFRKQAGDQIEPFPAMSTKVADTTCDGSVSVRLTKDGAKLEALPACIIVAPQDFSPDVDPAQHLLGFLKTELQISPNASPGNLHNETAQALDEAPLKTATARFFPGIEVCLKDGRSEVPDVRGVFYRPGLDPKIDPREMRVRYKSSPTDPGAVPGQLTSGLCSTWQGDFTACVGFWVEHLPTEVFLDEDSSVGVQFFRKQYGDTSTGADRLTSGEDFNRHVDKVGVARLLSGKRVETERNPGDDIADLIA